MLARRGRYINALTVDVEDYFQVSALAAHFPQDRWNNVPSRIEANVIRLLTLFAAHNARATFFTLGWIAERFPQLVREIASAGHEIASHGYAHQRVTDMTPQLFLEDLARAKGVLEAITGAAIPGYRAPSFSIGESNPWAHDCIAKVGHVYSSSVYPVRHDHYGLPNAPRFPYRLANGLYEIPITTARYCGRNWPAGGGGYFRFLPYAVSRWQIDRVNQIDHHPTIFYCHPWEFDPGQPRVSDAPVKARFRHYVNLERAEARLKRLLQDFSWDRADKVFLEAAIAA